MRLEDIITKQLDIHTAQASLPHQTHAILTTSLRPNLPLINFPNRLLQSLSPRPRNRILQIAVLKNRKNRHLADAQLLRDVARGIRVVLVELGFGELLDELVDERRDGFALRAPGGRGLQDDGAVGVAGFEVFWEGAEFFHCWSVWLFDVGWWDGRGEEL